MASWLIDRYLNPVVGTPGAAARDPKPAGRDPTPDLALNEPGGAGQAPPGQSDLDGS